MLRKIIKIETLITWSDLFRNLKVLLTQIDFSMTNSIEIPEYQRSRCSVRFKMTRIGHPFFLS
jgi:hypothetical protein